MNRTSVLLALLLLGVFVVGCSQMPPVATEKPATAEPLPTQEPTATPTPAPTATPTPSPTPAWGCPAQGASITLWHDWPPAHVPAIETLLGQYAEECPGATVKLVAKTDMYDILAPAPDEEQPDILSWWNREIGNLAGFDAITPVQQYIDAAALARAYAGVAIDAVTYNGLIYGLPESMSTLTLIYNKGLIDEEQLPDTTEMWLSAAADWKKTAYYFVYSAQNDVFFSSPWWNAAGVTMMDEAGNSDFASEAGYAAGNFIASLRNIMPPEVDYDTADMLFREGQAAITMNGPWYLADLDEAGIDYRLRPLPIFSPTGQPAAPLVEVRCLLLTSSAVDGGKAAAALSVMQYLTDVAAQVQLAQTNRAVPTNLAAASHEEVQMLPAVAVFAEQALAGKAMPNTRLLGAILDPVARGLECIWAGESPIQECIDTMQATADRNVAVMR